MPKSLSVHALYENLLGFDFIYAIAAILNYFHFELTEYFSLA